MIEEFEYKGEWWLPEAPEKRVSGTLKYTPGDRAGLELIGCFQDAQEMTKMLEPEIILGTSSDGKDITLYSCLETKLKLSYPGLPTSSFVANAAFVGAHFQKPEDIKFRSLSIRYSHFDEWLNISGFEIQHIGEEVVVKYNRPNDIQVTINDDYKVSIGFGVTYPVFSIVLKEASIKQKTYITIEASEENLFEAYHKVIYHIQNFLSLGVREPVYPLTIEGKMEASKELMKDGAYYPPVEIFYSLMDIPRAPKRLLPSDMLFTFKDISNRFEVFLRNWFEKATLLEPVYDLYFGTLYNPRMYLTHLFLSVIQGLESFHRRICGGEYLSPDNYKQDVYDALANAIPNLVKQDSSFEESLKTRLKYGNEFSLRKRLKEIIDKYWEIMPGFIPNKEDFINNVVDTRNYLTHYDPSLETQAAKEEKLYRITQKLKILLEICILTELGFRLEEIKGFFFRNYRYRQEFTQEQLI